MTLEIKAALAVKFRVLSPYLDERQRRLLMGAEAWMMGHGGIRAVARAAGASEHTVSQGMHDLDSCETPLGGRTCLAGAGRGFPLWMPDCCRHCLRWLNLTRPHAESRPPKHTVALTQLFRGLISIANVVQKPICRRRCPNVGTLVGRNPQVLASLARGRLRPRIPQLVEALTGRFAEHHAFICTMHLERIDSITRWVDELTVRIEVAMEPFQVARAGWHPGRV